MTSAQALHLVVWLVGSITFWSLIISIVGWLLRQNLASMGPFFILILSLVTFSTGVARTFTAWSWPICIAAGFVLGPLAWYVFGLALVALLGAGAWLVQQRRTLRSDDEPTPGTNSRR